MNFDIPADLAAYLKELDAFIEKEIRPLENANDNIRFFDHRREWARTDFDNGGLPRHEWEALLAEPSGAPTKPGICASRCLGSMATLIIQAQEAAERGDEREVQSLISQVKGHTTKAIEGSKEQKK